MVKKIIGFSSNVGTLDEFPAAIRAKVRRQKRRRMLRRTTSFAQQTQRKSCEWPTATATTSTTTTTANQRCSCRSGPGASRAGREALEAARGRSGLLNIISLEFPPATNYYYNHCYRHPGCGSSAQRCFRDPPQQLQSRANLIGTRRAPPLRLYGHLRFDVAGQP